MKTTYKDIFFMKNDDGTVTVKQVNRNLAKKKKTKLTIPFPQVSKNFK